MKQTSIDYQTNKSESSRKSSLSFNVTQPPIQPAYNQSGFYNPTAATRQQREGSVNSLNRGGENNERSRLSSASTTGGDFTQTVPQPNASPYNPYQHNKQHPNLHKVQKMEVSKSQLLFDPNSSSVNSLNMSRSTTYPELDSSRQEMKEEPTSTGGSREG